MELRLATFAPVAAVCIESNFGVEIAVAFWTPIGELVHLVRAQRHG